MAEEATWHRVGPVHVAAEEALSRGAALLAAATPDDAPTIAWWRVDRDTLVLGRGDQVAADEDACAQAGVPIVRRSSGGGPVLWGPDLLGLDLVIPRGHGLHRDDVVDAYRWPGELVAAALQTLGLPAYALTPAEARERDDPETARLACFAGRSPWEVVAWGGKVGGLSQVRRTNATLIQVGIRLAGDDGRLAGLLDISPGDRERIRLALTPHGGSSARWPGPDAVITAVGRALDRA